MDMQSGRGLPKNFRQIGSAEKSTKVYIEDYVYTYMRKLSQEDEVTVGALIGSNVVRDDTECVFISGMVKALGYSVGDDRISITDETWAQVFENVKRYFDGLTVCGWYISCPDSRLCSEGSVSGIYSCNNKNDSLLYIRDREIDEDFVYKVTAQDKILLSGYYIYYERNEQMQEYMIDTSGAKSVDPPPVNIMKKIEEKKRLDVNVADTGNAEMNGESREKGSGRGMYIAASLLLISFLVLGISIYRRSNVSIPDIPVISNLSNVINGRGHEEKDSTKESVEVTIESAWGLTDDNAVSESASGENEAVQTESDGQQPAAETGAEQNAVGQPADSGEIIQPEAQQPVQEGQAPEQPAAVEQQPEGNSEIIQPEAQQPAQQPVQEQQAPEQPAASPDLAQPAVIPGRLYVVQAGDTLSSICAKVYGREDVAMIEAIRNMNELENADYIFVGQVLSMP